MAKNTFDSRITIVDGRDPNGFTFHELNNPISYIQQPLVNINIDLLPANARYMSDEDLAKSVLETFLTITVLELLSKQKVQFTLRNILQSMPEPLKKRIGYVHRHYLEDKYLDEHYRCFNIKNSEDHCGVYFDIPGRDYAIDAETHM